VEPAACGPPRYVIDRVTEETRVLVPETVTLPLGTAAPSAGVSNATSGTTGVGVGEGTITISLVVWLA
jgi:hypothetical protein